MSDLPSELFKRVVDLSAERLESFGFCRRGNALRKVVGDIVGIIEFQKSTKNTSDSVSFTINLAVAADSLMEEGHPPLARVGSIDAQLRERVGMLLPGRPDKWWIIDSSTEEASLASEISDLLTCEAIPYLERYLNMDALVALWESGKSPGLTETQRQRYLARAHIVRASDK